LVLGFIYLRYSQNGPRRGKRVYPEEEKFQNSVEDQVRVAHVLLEQDYTPGSDGVKRTNLDEELESLNIELDYSVGTCFSHLQDINIVERWIQGPQILIVHDYQGVINGGDLDEVVADDIGKLINT